MRRKAKYLALFLALMTLAGCAAEVQPLPELKEPVGVQSDMATAYIGEIYTVDAYEGAVTPYVEELSFEVDGRVARVLTYPGEMVEEGQVLIELDQTENQERAQQLQDALAYAEQDNAYSDALAEIAIEKLEVELRQLRSTGADETAIALKELDIRQARTDLKQAQELREPSLNAQREELAKIEASLGEGCLRAPFTGRVIYGQDLHDGDWVSAYKTVIYMADDSRLSITGEYLSESVYSRADRIYALVGGQEYQVEMIPIPREDYIAMALSGVEIETEYQIIGPEDQLDQLESGQYAVICVVSRTVSDALLVPSGAIQHDASGKYVYVDVDGERERRMVKTGASNASMVQITEGLEEGETVYVKD